MSEAVGKKSRTLNDVGTDVSRIAQEIGVMHYQLEREIPREIEKRFNQLQDLNQEGTKLQKLAQDAQQAAMEASKEDSNVVDLKPESPSEAVAPV